MPTANPTPETVELFTTAGPREGELIVWERNPIPGGVDMPLILRTASEAEAIAMAREYLRTERKGSVFAAERASAPTATRARRPPCPACSGWTPDLAKCTCKRGR